MNGFPKHLNTKQDYLNCLKTMPEETKAALKEELEARLAWLPVKKLAASENPKLSATRKIMELPVDMGMGTEATETPEMERWLYEYKEDPAAWFFRLGFTVEEATAIINQ